VVSVTDRYGRILGFETGKKRRKHVLNSEFPNFAFYRYRNENVIQEEVIRLISGNACYHSVRNLSMSSSA
jgi:hypothetical protein